MAKRKLHIGHSQAQADLFAGLAREVTVETTNNELRVHDGATKGGFATARKDLANVDAATASNDGKMTLSQAADLASVKSDFAAHKDVGGSVHADATLSVSGFMSGADKTKLDGIDDLTAAEILALVLTVDGTGSGLDADLLDGNNSDFFATQSQVTAIDGDLTTEEVATLAHRTATGSSVHGLGSASIENVAVGGAGGLLRADGKGDSLTDLATSSVLAALFSGVQKGLILSNNATDALKDIDIAAGIAVNDAGSAFLVLGSTLIKRIDANWVVGTNQGGLDTGSVILNSWYHVWIIRRSDTGVVDILLSWQNPLDLPAITAPTMPTNYDQKCRIGSVLTDATVNILGFFQHGDYFFWKSRILELNSVNVSITQTLLPVTVPTGIKVMANIMGRGFKGSSAQYLLSSPQHDDNTPSTTDYDLKVLNYQASVEVFRETDTLGQIGYRASIASSALDILTLGWIDPRGRV